MALWVGDQGRILKQTDREELNKCCSAAKPMRGKSRFNMLNENQDSTC